MHLSFDWCTPKISNISFLQFLFQEYPSHVSPKPPWPLYPTSTITAPKHHCRNHPIPPPHHGHEKNGWERYILTCLRDCYWLPLIVNENEMKTGSCVGSNLKRIILSNEKLRCKKSRPFILGSQLYIGHWQQSLASCCGYPTLCMIYMLNVLSNHSYTTIIKVHCT